MTPQEADNFVNQLLDRHRIEMEKRPKLTLVMWQGIDMSVEEAKLVMREFEAKRQQLQQSLNRRKMRGNITTWAISGAGLIVIIVGAVLMLFSATMTAGLITLASGMAVAGIGKLVGDRIKGNRTDHTEAIRRLDTYIELLRTEILSVM